MHFIYSILFLIVLIVAIPIAVNKLTEFKLPENHWWLITSEYIESQGGRYGANQMMSGLFWYGVLCVLPEIKEEGSVVIIVLILSIAVLSSLTTENFIMVHRESKKVALFSITSAFLLLILFALSKWVSDFKFIFHFIAVAVALYWSVKVCAFRALYKNGMNIQ